MKDLTFTIVVPSFNQAKWLRLTLNSLVRQDYPSTRMQLIVMDGGSSDGSQDVIREFEQYIDYWQSKPDGGQANAIQDGLARADGEYLGWLNSDDLLVPHACSDAAAIARQGHEAMCAAAYHWSAEHAAPAFVAPMKPRSTLLKLYGNYIAQPTCFWSKRAWSSVGGLRPHLQRYLDLDLHLRLLKTGVRYHFTKKPRAVIVWHGENKSGSVDPVEEFEVLLRRKPPALVGKCFWAASHLANRNALWLARMANQRRKEGPTRGLGLEVPFERFARSVGRDIATELRDASVD